MSWLREIIMIKAAAISNEESVSCVSINAQQTSRSLDLLHIQIIPVIPAAWLLIQNANIVSESLSLCKGGIDLFCLFVYMDARECT